VVQITLNLPEELVTQAQEVGILTDAGVAALLHAEIERRQRVDHYFETLDRLAALAPPLSQEEIDAEMRAFRQEQKHKDS